MDETAIALLIGMALAFGIGYCGYRAGIERGRNERDEAAYRALDPEDQAGRLPSQLDELPATGRHHKAEGHPTPAGGFSLWPMQDMDTERMQAVGT